MPVRVVTRNGNQFTLASTFLSRDDVIAKVDEAVSESLVGSMSAAVDVWLDTDDGGAIRYSSVDHMEDTPA